jgi:predicted DNA-binding protein with PD1-like motif
MTMRTRKSESCRHLVLRASPGDILPDALAARLGEERVACGWLRASGVLADVELRAFDAQRGHPGGVRRIAGPVQVLALESSVGLVGGEPAFSLRAVLARETDAGLETLAGEIVRARSVALEALVTVLGDLALERTLDETTGLWLLDTGAPGRPEGGSAVSVPLPRPAAPAAAATSWSGALEASAASAQADRDRVPPGRVPGSLGAPIPHRPSKPGVDLDAPVPEAGDVVDHFAFGRCDVVKSDGERLHLRINKDGRIREIALEMLRVTPLDDDGTGRRFKLERRI